MTDLLARLDARLFTWRYGWGDHFLFMSGFGVRGLRVDILIPGRWWRDHALMLSLRDLRLPMAPGGSLPWGTVRVSVVPVSEAAKTRSGLEQVARSVSVAHSIAGKENQASLLSFPRQAKVEVTGPIRVGLGAGLGLLITQSRWWANLERPARHYHIWDIRGLVSSAISFS